jgi:type II secretory pathway pseudopilin PulG
MRTVRHPRRRITIRSASTLTKRERCGSPRRACGFTLIEVVIAAGLLIALCIGAAMLLTLTLDTIDRARHRAMGIVLARAKLEQLMSLTWSARSVGGVLMLSSDETTDASRAPPTTAGRGTLPSPTDALAVPHAGYVDYLDAQGQWVGAASGTAVPAGAVYVRRWSVERSGAGAAELLIVQVMVTTAVSVRAGAAAFGRSDRDAVWISGARLRRGA